MAPVVADNHDFIMSLITSLCTSPYPAISYSSPVDAVTYFALPVMDERCTPEICALLQDLDTLLQLYCDILSKLCSLKSTLSLEKKLREAAEMTCAGLQKATKLSSRLVRNKLPACVNQVPGVVSTYVWEGTVFFSRPPVLETDDEILLIVKTRQLLLDALTITAVITVPQTLHVKTGQPRSLTRYQKS